MGAGLLALPYAVMLCGLLEGIVLIFIGAWCSYYSLELLIHCAKLMPVAAGYRGIVERVRANTFIDGLGDPPCPSSCLLRALVMGGLEQTFNNARFSGVVLDVVLSLQSLGVCTGGLCMYMCVCYPGPCRLHGRPSHLMMVWWV